MCSTYQMGSYQTPTIYFYKTELELKNRQIADLKNQMNILLKGKTNLQSQVSNLQNQNYTMNASCEQEVLTKNQQWSQKEQDYLNQITSLQRENYCLQQQLNIKEGIENNFQGTVQNKLQQATKEINNLGVMNTIKETVMCQMENFYNKLNKLCGDRLDYELDFCNDELNVYKKRMKEIETKVIHYMQFENFHHKTYYDNDTKSNAHGNTEGNRDNDITKSERGRRNNNMKESKYCNKGESRFMSYQPPEMVMKIKQSENYKENRRRQYTDYSNGVRVFNNDAEERKRMIAMKMRNVRLSSTRTPPRDKEYEVSTDY